MEFQRIESLPPPPGVIGSLKAGLDAVATHVTAILLPLLLDAFLWLGPRLSLENLLTPAVSELFAGSLEGLSPEGILLTQDFYAGFTQWLEQFNLLSALRTFPIGIFSLMSARMPTRSLLGVPTVIQVPSVGSLLGWVTLLTLAGWIGGGLYFHWVSKVVSSDGQGAPLRLSRSIFQTVLFSAVWLLLLMILGMPTLTFLAALYVISPLVFQGALLLLGLLSFWLIVPFFFMPHGIFVHRQNALVSIYTSLQMARFSLPTSSLFVLSVLIITQGLNLLWSVPPENSWTTLIGIAGHAFITTALLAASFIFYRDMSAWVQTVFERLQTGTATPRV